MFQGSLAKFSSILWGRAGVLGSGWLPGLLGTAARFARWRHCRVPRRSSWLSVVRRRGRVHARLHRGLVGLDTEEVVRLFAPRGVDHRHVTNKRNIPRTSCQVNIHRFILDYETIVQRLTGLFPKLTSIAKVEFKFFLSSSGLLMSHCLPRLDTKVTVSLRLCEAALSSGLWLSRE